MSNQYRYELKYIINEMEYDYLKKRLSYVLKTDPHYEGTSYHVQSLYFDDLNDRALHEKMDGIEKRKKYRLRIYNHNLDFIRFECKIKDMQFIKKEQMRIQPELYNELRTGQYRRKFYRGHYDQYQNNGMIDYFFTHRFLYKPVIRIDYEREAYLSKYSNIRITLDKNIRFTTSQQMHSLNQPVMGNLFKKPMMVLEVKFMEYLPSYIKNLLQLDQFVLTALSKYALCRIEQLKLSY